VPPAPVSAPAASPSSGASSGNVQAATGKMSKSSLDFKNSKPRSISSLYELIGSSVDLPGPTPQSPKTRYPCPLNDASTLRQTLPLLLDKVTTSRGQDMPARINVNTAPSAVLAGLPGLQDSDVQNILTHRPAPAPPNSSDPLYQTPAWLITDAGLDAKKLQSIDRYITARSQVYRVQSVGYLDRGGPTARVEALIDTNQGYPRILYRRELSELGKGFDPRALSRPGGQ
jgi:hypothetical protein